METKDDKLSQSGVFMGGGDQGKLDPHIKLLVQKLIKKKCGKKNKTQECKYK